MNVKKWTALGICLALLAGLISSPALALDSGIYTAEVITSYYNPDTGNVDDGGTANAALGEGMCRSATGTTALVEVDGNDIWITVRLLLQSNCKNVALYTRTSYDKYSKVNYTVTAEDSANDSIDYRFKASDAGVKLKGTMYVTPMGRDVLWYLYLDTSTLAPGSGDFVVNIDTGDAGDKTAASGSAMMPAEPYGGKAGAQVQSGKKGAESGAIDVSKDGDKTDGTADSGQAGGELSESQDPDVVTPGQLSDDSEASEPTSAGAESDGQKADGQEGSDLAAQNDSEKSGGIGMAVGILAVVVVAGGVIFAGARRRRRS